MTDLNLTSVELEMLRLLSVSPISNVFINLLHDFVPKLQKSELNKILHSGLIYEVDSEKYPFYVSHEFKPNVREKLIQSSNVIELANYYQIVEEVVASILKLSLHEYDLLIMSSTQDKEIKYMRDLKILIHNSWIQLHETIINDIIEKSTITKGVKP